MTTRTGDGRATHTPTGPRRWLLLVMVLTLLTAGCRGSDDGAAPPDDEGDAATAATTEEGGSEAAASDQVATDVGVTDDACPNAVNPDNGCIYLGTLSDLTVGPFASQGPAIVEIGRAHV